MPHLDDHAPGRRRVGELGDPADLVQAEPDQRLALIGLAPAGAAGLSHFDRLAAHRRSGAKHRLVTSAARYSVAASASLPSRRRACSCETFRLRRAATE